MDRCGVANLLPMTPFPTAMTSVVGSGAVPAIREGGYAHTKGMSSYLKGLGVDP